MPPFDLTPLSGRYLSFREREEIALLRVQGAGVRQIARAIGRDPSTVSRELRRNAAMATSEQRIGCAGSFVTGRTRTAVVPPGEGPVRVTPVIL